MPEFISIDQWKADIDSKAIPDRRVKGDGTPVPEIGLRKFGALGSVDKDLDPVTGMLDIDFVISTEAVDRDDDVVFQNGWETDAYDKNPVVLWAHDYTAPPVALSMKTFLADDALHSIDRFTPQLMYPFGHMIYQMVQGKFLNATSVGFRPLEYVFNDEHKGYDFSRLELLEHSIVPVPANPEALVAAAAQGIDLAPLRRWAEKILDRDPDSDKVALWLPKTTIEEVHKQLADVAVSFNVSTSTFGSDVEVSDVKVVSATSTVEKSGDDDELELSDETLELVKSLTSTTDPKEDQMDEAIKELAEVVRTLTEAMEKMPDAVSNAVAEKVASMMTEKAEGNDGNSDDTDDTESDFAEAVRDATAQAVLKITGALPE